MNSGLYAFAGDSATATAAACANRLDEPMTNVSNVYFGFSRLPPESTPGLAPGRRSSRPVPAPGRGRPGGSVKEPAPSAAARAAATPAGMAAPQPRSSRPS